MDRSRLQKPSWYENMSSLQTYLGSNKEAADNYGDEEEVRKGGENISKLSIQRKNGARGSER